MVLGPAQRAVDAPLGRRGRLQHLAHRRAACAHRLDEVAHAARAVGVLVAVAGLIARSLDDACTRDQSASISSATTIGRLVLMPGAHLGAVRDDRHGAVLVDGDEDVRIVAMP